MQNNIAETAERTRREGLLLLLLSASGYAFLPIFAKWGYAAGLQPIDLVTWRFIVATPLIWLLILLRRPTSLTASLPDGRLLASGAFFALLALTAFSALARIPSSTYTLLLYTYPAMVALLSHLRGERLAGRGWAALLLTLVGIALTVPAGAAGLRSADPLGLGLGFLNASLYAIYIVLNSRLLRGHTSLVLASGWSITGSLLLLLGIALARGLAWPVGPAAWGSALALAAVSTVIPIFTFFAGMQRVGAARAAILSTVEPMLTLLLATLLLGEQMVLQQWLGAGLILLSVLLLQSQGNATAPAQSPLSAAGDRSPSLEEPEGEAG